MATYPQFSIGSAADLYKTNYYGGSPDADITDTEVFMPNMDITVNIGWKGFFKYLGSNATDLLIITLYHNITDTWDGDEEGKEYEFANLYTAENIVPFHLSGLDLGPGHYRFGAKSADTSTTFDLHARGYFYRFENADS